MLVSINYYYTYILVLLSKFIYGFLLKSKSLYLYIKPFNLLLCLTFLKLNSLISLNSLLDIVVLDSLNTGINRFSITYVFISYTYNLRIFVRSFTDGLYPLFSISNLYKSSDWLEREAFDMFGLKFLFHTDLRRILTDYGFKGFPLRKDFPVLGFVEVLYDDRRQAINLRPVESSQQFRLYHFLSSWFNIN